MRARHLLAAAGAIATAGVLVTACKPVSAPTASSTGKVIAVAAENQYGNVIAQIGGKYVQVASVESNPNTDPHSFEASAQVSAEVSQAQLVVQNGAGYDTFMNSIESASPSSHRKVINVQQVLGLRTTPRNPHLWYAPGTMPAVARAVAADLAQLRPAHAGYFRANVVKFDDSLKPWLTALAQFRSHYGGTPVAVTEPVGDYLLQAAGARILTPYGLQADIMNGVDVSPQYVTLEDNLFREHKVKVFVYNQQVVDSVTAAFLATAQHYGIPVVGVYETMPTPGYSYQSWMLAEVNALRRAVADKISTQKL